MKHYDAIVIGAGQAGIPLAKKLAESGKKTALIEKRIVGGTCINDGCTPTKAMIASAQAIYKAKNLAEMGVVVGKVKIDFKQVKKRTKEIVDAFRGSAQRGILETDHLDLIDGDATFSGLKEVTVRRKNGNSGLFTADLIFINTGASPVIPDIEGINEIQYLTSTTILELDEIPKHLVIIGGNYIGLEFGQMFRRFGSKVTIIEREGSIMPNEDEDAIEELTEILKEEGISIITDATVNALRKKRTQVGIKIGSKGKESEISASHVLFASGRKPQTQTLNLGITGVNVDGKGFIKVNGKLETSTKGIYALGDVKGGPAFTHIAYNDYTIIFRNLVKGADLTTVDRPVPYCMYTDPQLGRIGITEKEAKAQGVDCMVAKLPMKYVARGIVNGETRGFMKAVVERNTGKILGACILSSEGGEIMSVLDMAMEGNISYEQIRYFTFAHPTYTESLNNLFMTIHK